MRITFALIVAAWTLVGAAAADEATWQALNEPGAIAIMRHALAPGTGDPANFTLGDCTTQRNLSDRGRAQARRIGAAFKNRGITFDGVYSSQWCRCLETAELLDLGEVTEFAALNSFFADRSKRGEQTETVRTFLAARPGERLMLVTHQVNIAALTGRRTRSGEVIVIDVASDGEVSVLGSITMSAY